MKPQQLPAKKRPAKRKPPPESPTPAQHCARLAKCTAGSCHYPQPCNHQTLQPTAFTS